MNETAPPSHDLSTQLENWSGALLVRKEAGVSSFGVIEALQRKLQAETGLKRKDLPKLGHGGTLDPFATGLLPVCVGHAVKLARYFLGGSKEYTGIIHFGQTTVPGDPTSPVTETSERVPTTLEEIQTVATQLTKQIYLQTPPMHSAKKLNGKPLYELAREGIEVDREPKPCSLFDFEITEYTAPLARFRVAVSSGTYIRVLAQDLGRLLGGVAMLDTLERTMTANLRLENALALDEIKSPWPELGATWIPFDRLLEGYPCVDATEEEARALVQGKQQVLFPLLKRVKAPTRPFHDDCVVIYHRQRLIGVTRLAKDASQAPIWSIERVFQTTL